MATLTVSRLAVIGKVPCFPEFLRIGHRSDAILALESFLDGSMSWADGRYGRAWSSPFSRGRTFGFLVRGHVKGKAVLGAIRPSSDRIGRQFPIAACYELLKPVSADAMHSVPLACHEWFVDVERMLSDSARVVTPEEIEPLTQTLASPYAEALPQRLLSFGGFTQTLLEQVWPALFQGQAQVAAAASLYTLLEAVKPFRKKEDPTTSLAMRVPLGRGHAMAAAFWLRAVLVASEWRGSWPSVFWSYDATGGEAVIHLGCPGARALGELWYPDPDDEYLCDMVAPPRVDTRGMLAASYPEVSRTLSDPSANVADLFLAIAR